jgi:hypothetical protein
VRWKEWKTTAAKRHNLRIRGISESSARKWGGSSKGYWRVAGSKILQVSLSNSYWDRLGLKTLSQTLAASQLDGLTNRRMRAPHVRWCGRGRGDPAPYPISGGSTGTNPAAISPDRATASVELTEPDR